MTEYSIVRLATSDELAEWDHLVEQSKYGTVFHFSWWLHAASQRFEIVGIRDAYGILVGGIPLPFRSQLGLKLVRNPPLTPYLGPIFRTENKTDFHSRASLERDAGKILASSLNGFDSFNLQICPCAPDLQGFLWNRFAAHLHYTFVFLASTQIDEVITKMHPKHRSEIAKAERRKVKVIESDDIKTFLALNSLTYPRQQLQIPYTENHVQSIWKAAACRGNAKLFLAANPDGNISDGALFVFDSHCVYLVMSAGDPKYRGNGGGNLTVWQGIQYALNMNRSFDFEGSSIPGVEFYYRRWGASSYPAFSLSKTPSQKGKIAMGLRNLWRS